MNKLLLLLLLIQLTAISGEPIPPQPPQITAQNPAAKEYNDIMPLLQDFQGTDEAKRTEAEKKLIDKGNIAYRMLAGLSVNPDAAVATRAKDLRTKIEKRAENMLQNAQMLQAKLQEEPLSAAKIEAVRTAWATSAAYVPQNAFRQQAMQYQQFWGQQLEEFETANKLLAETEARLAAKPPLAGVALAAVLMQRAESFSAVQRFDDAFKAAQDCAAASGKDGRHAPPALKMQLEIAQRKKDNAAIEALCKKIIADHADSFEASTALSSLVDFYIENKRWDNAVATAKDFMTVCPLDEAAQESTYGLLDKLMEAEHDYPRAYGLASWLRTKLPASRLKPEILRTLGNTSEYAMKDFAKAEDAYKALGAQYADIVTPADVDRALNRVHAKAEGKFPKEPKAADGTPEGALGKFIAAVRARDEKAVSAAVPAASAKEAAEALTGPESDLVSSITFADFVLKDTKLDGDKAELTIDYYDSSSATPKTVAQKALKENGAWKIQWQDPETQLNPAAKKDKLKEN